MLAALWLAATTVCREPGETLSPVACKAPDGRPDAPLCDGDETPPTQTRALISPRCPASLT